MSLSSQNKTEDYYLILMVPALGVEPSLNSYEELLLPEDTGIWLWALCETSSLTYNILVRKKA